MLVGERKQIQKGEGETLTLCAAVKGIGINIIIVRVQCWEAIFGYEIRPSSMVRKLFSLSP